MLSRLVALTLPLAAIFACTSFESTDAPLPSGDAGPDVASPQLDSGAIEGGVDVDASTPSSAYAATVLADTPEAFWRFMEAPSSPGLTSAVNAHVLLGGNTKATYGVPGLFGGTAGAIRLDENAARAFSNTVPMRFPEPFAVETWIYLDAPLDGAIRGIAGQSNGTSSFYVYHYDQGSLLILETVSGAEHAYAAFTGLTPNVWHHVVAQAASVLAPELFVDGQAGVVMNGDQSVLPTVAFTLGAINDASLALAPGAKLAEVAVYNHVLTPMRITAHIVAGKTQ